MESLEGECIIRMGWDKTHCLYSKFMATHIKKVLTAFQCTGDSLDYCFSHLNVHQNHLEDWLNCRMLNPSPAVSDSVLGVGP